MNNSLDKNHDDDDGDGDYDDEDDDDGDLDIIPSILLIPLMVTLTPIIASNPPHNGASDYCAYCEDDIKKSCSSLFSCQLLVNTVDSRDLGHIILIL